MTSQVVALGAWCDYETDEEASATPGGANFRVHEFAILEDGRRITIRDDLGFTSWAHLPNATVAERADASWRRITRESLEREIRTNIVVPDETDFVDEHPYEWLRELLRRQGIEVTEEHLRAVPYTVEFSERLERRLAELRSP